MSKDQAARIAENAKMLFCGSLGDTATYEAEQIEARIRRAIADAVRKERERCVGCAEAEAVESMKAKRFVSAYRIIKAINGGKRKKNAEAARMVVRYDDGVRKATAKQLDKATTKINGGKR